METGLKLATAPYPTCESLRCKLWATQPLIQPYSGHDSRQSLEIYSKLLLGDCQPEYEKRIKDFPI